MSGLANGIYKRMSAAMSVAATDARCACIASCNLPLQVVVWAGVTIGCVPGVLSACGCWTMPPRRKLNETTVRGNTFKVGDSCLINSDAPSSLPFVSCRRVAALTLFVELARNRTPGGHETHGCMGGTV